MFRGRRKNAAVVAGASVLVAISSLAIVPLAAGAQATDVGTMTTVTVSPPSTRTGAAVSIVARVHPVTTDATVITGTVTFTITGHNSSTVNCHVSDTVTVKHGKATCKVPVEELQAEASPYSIAGTYSGDSPNYTGSSGTASETVIAANVQMKLKASPKVSNGSGNTFIATLKSGAAGSLLAGNVRFGVTSPYPTRPRWLTCGATQTSTGSDIRPVAVSGNVGTATCVLHAGWFTVPPPTHTEKHGTATYGVTAVYLGNGNFNSKQKTKSGTLTS